MPNTLRIKTAFASSVLRETAEKIRAEQMTVAEEWNLFKTGTLKEYLQGHFSISAEGESSQLSMSYLAYARWLDMQDARRRLKREGYHLYNRLVFGILYNRTLPAMKYGFTREVHETIGNWLKNIAEQDKGTAAVISKSLRSGYF